tara:strand:- start:91 stop:414 length:324 start_codon:yes stop_codon:yes gene_type:complete
MGGDSKKQIANHHLYTTSLQNLIDVWIEAMHPENYIIVVWDALLHYDKLRKMGFKIDEAKIFDNKILTIQVNSYEDAISIFKMFFNDQGPFVQVYCLGKLITDNIDK